MTRHRWTACIVSALLLLQAAPLAVWVGDDDHASHRTSCSHCNGSFCLRNAHRPCTKCAHHRAAAGSRAPGVNHDGHATHSQQSASALHAAPVSPPERGGAELCGCGHQRAPGSLVPALDKVILAGAIRPRPPSLQRRRFVRLAQRQPEARAEEPFHPPRTLV